MNPATLAAYLSLAEEVFAALSTLLKNHASTTASPDAESAALSHIDALAEKHAALKAAASE